MRILLLGADGQVGHELRGPLATFAEVTPLTRKDLDLTDLDWVRTMIERVQPHAIVNTVAWNEVDKAETDRAGAMRLNAEVVALLGELAKARKFALVTYSSDFVFDGESPRPYLETDPTHPISAYGESKLAGENALLSMEAPALIFRTAWVWSLRRKSFVSAILGAARTRELMKVVDDQVGSPTWARDLAVATAMILFDARRDPHGWASAHRGLYHLAGAGVTTRHAFASAAIELDPKKSEHVVKSIEKVPSSAFPLPAKRPRFAPLDCSKARSELGVALPDWRDALVRAFAGS
ncbi:MAG: dTDP-4-dehydrorhamnose reductase [Polyangiales bacterium]